MGYSRDSMPKITILYGRDSSRPLRSSISPGAFGRISRRGREESRPYKALRLCMSDSCLWLMPELSFCGVAAGSAAALLHWIRGTETPQRVMETTRTTAHFRAKPSRRAAARAVQPYNLPRYCRMDIFLNTNLYARKSAVRRGISLTHCGAVETDLPPHPLRGEPQSRDASAPATTTVANIFFLS